MRDYLEEAEAAVGMVQKAIEDEKLKPSDIGLLIPADRGYAVAVQDTFSLAGIPLSGLNTDRPLRDLGREAVMYFLLCRRTPAPVMALAALFTSSLMPWSREQGYAFASQVMKGNYRFKLDRLQPTARQMVTLIRQDSEQPIELAEAVELFVGLLDFSGELTEHRQNAIAAGEAVAAALRKASGEMPWKEIISLAAPKAFSVARSQDISREGIAVFSEEDLIMLKQKLGYDFETASEVTNRGRDLLRRQLSAASGDVGAEVELTGSLDKLPLAGKTDLLIALPGGRMFVVDYKKSKSKKRRAQMEKGWDSQTSLYRVMLKTGGVKDGKNKDVANAIKAASDVGVLYYMMNDQTILADTAQWLGRDMAGVEEMGANISQNAMAQILERIKELRNGILILNREGDNKEIEKETGMTAKYALEKSPLVQLFMKEEEEPA